MKIIKAYAVNNLCYKAQRKMTPKGIVVHSTGANNPNLKRYVDAPDEVGHNRYGNHWNVEKPDGQKKCVHAFIGYDNDGQLAVAEILPLNICCWGVGKGSRGSYNYSPAYIQFEICEDSLGDSEYYRKAFDMAMAYCAKLCKEYSIDAADIVGHNEAHKRGYGSNHSDPEHWMRKHSQTMDDFRQGVRSMLTSSNNQTDDSTDIPSAATEFHKGDLVSLTEDATYYSGRAIPKWVKQQNWYISEEPVRDRIVINKNEQGVNSICSPVNSKFVRLVCAAEITQPDDNDRCPFLVRVTTKSLNIRKGAGTHTQKVGTITDMGVYTIVEKKRLPSGSVWGRLKSGAGWISLNYTKKL